MHRSFRCLDKPVLFAENRTVGILWMLATMFCFIALDALMKYALQTYSLVEVTWGRFFFATLMAIFVGGKRLPQLVVSRAPKRQTLRSFLLMMTTGLFNAGLVHLPLAVCTTIMFLSPILVTMLSNLVLGEHVGIRRWIGIAIGFCGALVVIRIWETGLTGLNISVLLVLGAAFANASYQITTRGLRHEDPLTSLLFTGAVGALVTSIMLPYYWIMPDAFGWFLLIMCGVAGCVGHLCLIRAFQAAPASVVAPFSYSSLIWSTLFGFIIWSDIPNWSTLLGAALIMGSGLYIFLREKHLAKSNPTAPISDTP
jgi:drug/metabolite transporter (DMT)-like permease